VHLSRPYRWGLPALVSTLPPTVALSLPLALMPTMAQAHAIVWTEASSILPALALVMAWIAYSWGAWRRRPPRARQLAFHAGLVIAALSLFGPLDTWSKGSVAWHMVQHMLLIGVVAPLLVLAAPLGAWRSACGPRIDGVARGFVRLSRWPMTCAAIHAAALWFWHAPGPYALALNHPGWHWVAHAGFLLSALLFWQATLRAGRTQAMGGTAALLATLMHTGALGALLTFAHTPLYPPFDLADQQLAGLVMWVPGGMVYVVAMAALVARTWLRAVHDAPAWRPEHEPTIR
jgi:putative membrane protein